MTCHNYTRIFPLTSASYTAVTPVVMDQEVAPATLPGVSRQKPRDPHSFHFSSFTVLVVCLVLHVAFHGFRGVGTWYLSLLNFACC